MVVEGWPLTRFQSPRMRVTISCGGYRFGSGKAIRRRPLIRPVRRVKWRHAILPQPSEGFSSDCVLRGRLPASVRIRGPNVRKRRQRTRC